MKLRVEVSSNGIVGNQNNVGYAIVLKQALPAKRTWVHAHVPPAFGGYEFTYLSEPEPADATAVESCMVLKKFVTVTKKKKKCSFKMYLIFIFVPTPSKT